MGTQEGCRDGKARDAPSGESAAWGGFCYLQKRILVIILNNSSMNNGSK